MQPPHHSFELKHGGVANVGGLRQNNAESPGKKAELGLTAAANQITVDYFVMWMQYL